MKFLPLLLSGLVFLVEPFAADLVPEAPSAVLLDQATGRVLFQKQPDLSIPPASLTKLMTLHLAWKALQEGRVQAGDLVPVTEETTGKNVPPGSSLMFLEPGQRVTFAEMMLGLAVDSGNDAGLTLARFLEGSQQVFVAAMNAEAAALGLSSTVFYDTYGYDARNRTTAADFARFSRLYLTQHPQAVQMLHNVRELAFPLNANRAPGDGRRARTIVQANRNSLLWDYPGADGLKTGYIEESGYNLAATALRGEQRLVAVLLGVQGRTTEEGGRRRTAAAARLLDFGFENFPLRPLPVPEAAPIRVWLSSPGALVPVLSGRPVYPLESGETAGISVRVSAPTEILGPVAAHALVGHVIWTKDGRDFFSVELRTAAPAEKVPWWTELWENIILFFRGLFGTPPPVRV